MYYKMTSSDHRHISIAAQRVAKLDVVIDGMEFYKGFTPSGRHICISIDKNWVEVKVRPVINGHVDYKCDATIYARQTSTSEDHSELDKALNILRWLFDLKTLDASPVGVIRRK